MFSLSGYGCKMLRVEAQSYVRMPSDGGGVTLTSVHGCRKPHLRVRHRVLLS